MSLSHLNSTDLFLENYSLCPSSTSSRFSLSSSRVFPAIVVVLEEGEGKKVLRARLPQTVSSPPNQNDPSFIFPDSASVMALAPNAMGVSLA